MTARPTAEARDARHLSPKRLTLLAQNRELLGVTESACGAKLVVELREASLVRSSGLRVDEVFGEVVRMRVEIANDLRLRHSRVGCRRVRGAEQRDQRSDVNVPIRIAQQLGDVVQPLAVLDEHFLAAVRDGPERPARDQFEIRSALRRPR